VPGNFQVGGLVHRLKERDEGIGFFLGGALLQFVGFSPALWLMAAMLFVPLVGVTLSLPKTLGKAKSSKTFRELFAKTRAINLSRGPPVSSCSGLGRLVRGRVTGVYLCERLALHRGCRVPRRVDDRLRRRAALAPW